MREDPRLTTDDVELRSYESSVAAELQFPIDAHVIGEPVMVTKVRYTGSPRIGLLATCEREEHTYEVDLADVVFPSGSEGARAVARYRAWLGFREDTEQAYTLDSPRPHKVASDDITVGDPVELIVLACKSNALRCRLLGTAREVTLRTAVRYEIPGSIITVTPRKQWTHARHPYLSGEVSEVRIDATVLGLVPLSLHREGESAAKAESVEGARGKRSVFRMERVTPGATGDLDSDAILEAQECIDVGNYAEADELLTKILALDLRCLDAHALLGERAFRHMPLLALHHYALGAKIGSLSIGDDFDGSLPWGLLDNRPFLRCLHGMACALHRLGRGDAAAGVFRRLLHLDPADHLCAREGLAAIEAGKKWKETEGET